MVHRILACLACAGAFITFSPLSLWAGVKLGEKASPIIGLLDLHGNTRTLADYRPAKLRVLVFLGTECPVANVYLPVLIEMEKELAIRTYNFWRSTLMPLKRSMKSLLTPTTETFHFPS